MTPIRWLGIVAYAAIVLLRHPPLVTQPRLWAEEGTVYLQAALDHGWFALSEPHLGYFALYPNVATFTASLGPLAWVPAVTLVWSLLGHLAPAIVAVTSRVEAIQKAWPIILLALLFVPAGGDGEVWLNTVNSQVFFTVGAFMLMMEEELRPARLAALAIFALSAPSVAFLAPLFLVRALWRRTRATLGGLGVVAFAGLVNVVANVLTNDRSRVNRDLPSVVEAMLEQGVVRALFPQLPGSHEVGLVIVALLVVVALLSRAPVMRWAVAAWVLLTALGTWFSLLQTGGGRYAFASSVILVIGLASIIVSKGRWWLRVVALVAVGAILLAGGKNYRPFHAAGEDWPNWASQVASGSRDILVWPEPAWSGHPWVVHLP